MKKALSILLTAILVLTSAAALAETVVIAASPVPHAEVLEFIKPLMAEKGFELDIRIFDDYVLPNLTVESGEIDANYFQHTNYMNVFNRENDTHITNVIPVHFEPMGVFKGKTQSLEELKDGAVIAVPNDTSNQLRALQLLETLGLVQLNPDVDNASTLGEMIAVNDRNFKIEEMAAAELPRRLTEFDLAVINGNYALAAGLSLIEDAVAAEGSDAQVYRGSVNWICVKEGNEDAAFVEALREAFNDLATAEFMITRYQGSVVLALELVDGLEMVAINND